MPHTIPHVVDRFASLAAKQHIRPGCLLLNPKAAIQIPADSFSAWLKGAKGHSDLVRLTSHMNLRHASIPLNKMIANTVGKPSLEENGMPVFSFFSSPVK